MSGSAHSNTSEKWLIFFFVCFGICVLSIGVFAFASFINDRGVAGGDGYSHSGTAAAGGH